MNGGGAGWEQEGPGGDRGARTAALSSRRGAAGGALRGAHADPAAGAGPWPAQGVRLPPDRPPPPWTPGPLGLLDGLQGIKKVRTGFLDGSFKKVEHI